MSGAVTLNQLIQQQQQSNIGQAQSKAAQAAAAIQNQAPPQTGPAALGGPYTTSSLAQTPPPPNMGVNSPAAQPPGVQPPAAAPQAAPAQGGIQPPNDPNLANSGVPNVGSGTGVPGFGDNTLTDENIAAFLQRIGVDPAFWGPTTKIGGQFDGTNLKPGFLQVLELLSGSGLGDLASITDPHSPVFDKPAEGDAILQALGGIFRGDEDVLGIKSEEGGAPLGFATNISFADFLRGAQRGQEREGMLRDLIDQQAASPQAALAQGLAGTALQNIDPSALDERFGNLENRIRTTSNQQLNQSRNRLQDLGLAGQGGLQAPALAGLEAQTASNLAQQIQGLDEFRAQEERANLEAATRAGALSTDMQRALNVDPVLNLISSLAGPQNVQSGQFQDSLERISQLASGTALANRREDQTPQLVGAGIGAIGNILGPLLGKIL